MNLERTVCPGWIFDSQDKGKAKYPWVPCLWGVSIDGHDAPMKLDV
jgi:hypothetical protein